MYPHTFQELSPTLSAKTFESHGFCPRDINFYFHGFIQHNLFAPLHMLHLIKSMEICDGPAIIMGLPSSWACHHHGPAIVMGLPSSWACHRHGPAIIIALVHYVMHGGRNITTDLGK
jgi:hypothetical protein